jgi:uncharacterized protein (TIGR02217 family)
MSTFVLAPGWKMKKHPSWSTQVQETQTKRGSVYVPQMVYPVWTFEIEYPLIQGSINDSSTTLGQLHALAFGAYGRAVPFLYRDALDHSVTNAQFGTGDGSTKDFQLRRPIGGGWDIIQNLDGAAVIKVDGVTKTLTTDYTMSDAGVVSFVSAPANNKPLTFTTNFNFMVRFLEDDPLSELEQQPGGWWTVSSIGWETVIQ